MKEQFINRYPLSKTLRFSLIPVGKTEENFNSKLLLEEDEKRAEEYVKVKGYIDEYHKVFIDRVLSGVVLENIADYAGYYYKNEKTDSDKEQMTKLEEKMRKQIATALKKDGEYNSLKGQDLIKKILPGFLKSEKERASVEMFANFTTYFRGFQTNRENMYSELAQSTAISFRCVNENLPRFLDNAKSFSKVKELLPEGNLKALEENFSALFGIHFLDVFKADYFSFVLAQSGIDKYNGILGGYTCSDGTKIQGLNEFINLYNQQVAKSDKSKKLPFMKQLYKQILSDRESVSFIPEQYKTDDEVISSVNDFYHTTVEQTVREFAGLFRRLSDFDSNGIFIKSGLPVTDISNAVFGVWSAVSSAWENEYEAAKPIKKGADAEKYHEAEKKAYNKIASFSISEIQRLGEQNAAVNAEGSVVGYYSHSVPEAVEAVTLAYNSAEKLLTTVYSESHEKKLCSDTEAIEQIKNLLDSVKDLERLVKPLVGTGKEENKDELFYGEFLPLFDAISQVDRLYDKVRNYVTRKPYSKDKIKLNFGNPQLLGGWDKNKERDYRTILLRKNGYYYLAIMNKEHSKVFVDAPEATDGSVYEKMEYKLLPGPNKMLPKVFFATSNIEKFMLDKEILEIRKKESFKKGVAFNLEDCHKFIDFFKSSIEKHPDWSQFGFNFTPTEQYGDISEFYREVSDQGYSIRFKPIPESYINEMIDCGYLYLFQIYNKDFSEYSKGMPNLHTLYFRMLFDERNLSDVVFKLNGEAEMFYRKASISEKEKIVHPANKAIKNKNPDNTKTESNFDYDIVKDRRFTKRQFSLHVPITINFKAHGQENLNNDVRLLLKNKDDIYVIGIDRGERNLIYISVVDGSGKIIEQKSLNEIIGDNGYRTDYHKLLDLKEKERDAARKSWGTIEGIKELKEGYISQVVHEICRLVLKYDAVIAMEDLNFGFKKGRFSVEKQVYQKFENMLISKLNFLCDKKADPENEGGLLKAYQLTNKFDGVNRGKQNGIIFYVPAWDTSKIDPATGFANLLKPKYSSVSETKHLIENIDDIRYNSETDMFEFDIDYSKFPRCNADYKKRWTVCTNGDRIETFRNPQKNSEWDNRRVELTAEFKALFADYGVDINMCIKKSVLNISDKGFFVRFIKLFALTLQMRNSVTGSTAPEDDYLISPVCDATGVFYDSRNYHGENASMPADADANGAYNIARKGLWAINQIKNSPADKLDNVKLAVSNAEWLEFAQK